MRLSATDRIIREAAQHDDAAVEEVDHPDTEKVSAAPFVALGIPAPRMPTPLGGGVDIDIEDDDGQDQDEEGETQVDAKRSAAALKEMRALQASVHTPPPQTTSPSGSHRPPRGVPPGRPGGTSAMNLTPPPVAMPAALATAPANTTLAFGTAATGVGLAPKAPAPPRLPGFTPPPALPDDNRPEHMFSSSRIQFGAVAMPPAASTTSGLSMAPRRSGRVGRRTGAVIAASTALAVALIAGAWTAKNTAPVRTVIARPSLTPSLVRGATAATPPRAAITPVIVSTPPAAPIAKAPEPAEAPPAPEAALPTPAPAATEAAPAPTTAPARTAPLSKRAQAAAAKLEKKKAKLAKRKAALAAAAARRRARAHKATKTAVAAPAPTVAAPASSSPRPSAPRPAEAPRGRMDPDDTLPITD